MPGSSGWTSKSTPARSSATCAAMPDSRSMATSSVALSLQSPYLLPRTVGGGGGVIEGWPAARRARDDRGFADFDAGVANVLFDRSQRARDDLAPIRGVADRVVREFLQ